MISVELGPSDRRVIFASFSEYGGGSADAMRNISGHSESNILLVDRLFRAFWESDSSVLTLPEEHWRIVYDSINATITALGPFELQTCTGCDPIDMLQTNLTIASKVWGAYGGAKWSDYYKTVRV